MQYSWFAAALGAVLLCGIVLCLERRQSNQRDKQYLVEKMVLCEERNRYRDTLALVAAIEGATLIRLDDESGRGLTVHFLVPGIVGDFTIKGVSLEWYDETMSCFVQIARVDSLLAGDTEALLRERMREFISSS